MATPDTMTFPDEQALQRVAAVLARHRQTMAWPATSAAGVLAAVSGGADSVALALLLAELHRRHRLPGPLVLAHVDHAAREGSTAAAAAVRHLAVRLGLPACEQRLGPWPSPPSEATLRHARYDALLRLAREHDAGLVLTAHHRDDQLETLVLRLMRKAGPRGLAGMRVARPLGDRVLLRPLLWAPRRRLFRLVAACGETSIDDPTNRDLDRARNRIRHRVLPALRRELGPSLPHMLLRLGAEARRITERLDRQASRRLDELAFQPLPWRLELPSTALACGVGLQRELVREAHRRLTGTAPPWPWLVRSTELLHQRTGTHTEGEVLTERTRNGLLLVHAVRAGSLPSGTSPLVVDGAWVAFGDTGWHVRARSLPSDAPRLPCRQRTVLDPAAAPPPYALRALVAGDRFWPPGMPGPVHLHAHLMARGVPRFDRTRLPLVIDRDHRVVWVAGIGPAHGAVASAGTDGVEIVARRR